MPTLEESDSISDSANNRRRSLIQCFNAINTLLRKLKETQPSYEDEDVESPKLDLAHHTVQLIDGPDTDDMEAGGIGDPSQGTNASNTRSPPVLTPATPPPIVESVVSLQALADRVNPKQGMDKRSNVVDVTTFLLDAHEFLSSLDDKARQDEAILKEKLSQASPRFQPVTIDMCWHQLAETADSLCVYGNQFPGLLRDLLLLPKPMQVILAILQRACFLTGEAIEGRRDDFAPKRTTNEINLFRDRLKNEGVPPNLLDKIATLYALEFLFDACLPPAVCSGRYEGIQLLICEKKAALCSDLLHQRNKAFFSTMSKTSGNSNGVLVLSHLCALGLSGTQKVRRTLYDRLISEGSLLQLLLEFGMTPTAVSSMTSSGSGRTPKRASKASAAASLDTEAFSQCMDVLCQMSDPTHDEAVNTPATTGRKSTGPKQIYVPQWVTDPNLPRVIEACSPALEIATQRRDSKKHLLVEKIVEFLRNCLVTKNSIVMKCVVDLIDTTMHKSLKCQTVDVLLPLMSEIICWAEGASLETGGGTDTTVLGAANDGSKELQDAMREQIPRWFTHLSTHVTIPNSFLDRDHQIMLMNYFRFAIFLCQNSTWREGVKNFLTKIYKCALTVKEKTSRRPNLVFSVAQRTVIAVEETVRQLNPSLRRSAVSSVKGTSTQTKSKRKRASSESSNRSDDEGGGGSVNRSLDLGTASPGTRRSASTNREDSVSPGAGLGWMVTGTLRILASPFRRSPSNSQEYPD